MKVLQINATYGVGSTGKIVRDISDELISQGHQSYVMWATACKKDNSNVKLIRIGTTLDHKIHAVARRVDHRQAWHSKYATKRACKKIKALNPDIVHLHNLHSNYIHLPTLLTFLGKNNIPTLVTFHDCWFFTGGCTHYRTERCNKWLENCEACPIFKSAAPKMFANKKVLFSNINSLAVNGVSKWTAEDAKKSILSSATLIDYIYNWIDTELFKTTNSRTDVVKKYNIPTNHKIILGVSQGWDTDKGLLEFVEIANSLKDIATVILVGKCDNKPQVENIRCIGYTQDIHQLIDLYSAADVFVNPSRAETFGLVTAEALACGTPVAAYNNSGTAEIVTNSCGILAEDGNFNALINATNTILQNGKSYYSNACRSHICENFEKSKQTQKYIEFYEKILANNKF